MSNSQLLEDLGIDLKRIKTSGKTVCPKCSHGRKKKTDPCLSVDIDQGMYKCHNCDWKGYVFHREVRKEVAYTIPAFNNRTELPVNVVDWFFKRKISQQTLIDLKITYGPEWMPQTNKEVQTIQFNYFRSGELVNVKYRDSKKNFKLVKGAELILYNLDAIADSDECIVCEGEIDAMSWHEAGVKNVVSVPNGASKNQKLEYIDNCYKYFENKTKIYLSTDNDEPGINLREELCRRFGVERCFKIDFGDSKDANEYLEKYDAVKLANLLAEAKEFPIEGVFTINDTWAEIEHIYNYGLPTGDKTGDIQLDEHIGFMPGELTMVTGIPGHGKSIFLDQVSLGLALNSNWQFAVCSPESYPLGFYYTRLIKRLTGKKFSRYNITPDQLNNAREWIQNRYNVIIPPTGFNLDQILEKAKHLVLRKGIKGLIIDPWNRIESNLPNNYDVGKFINEQLTKIINFNQQTGVHTFLVAHPTKQLKIPNSPNYTIPNLYGISGSAHFFNMTQNGLTVYRNYETMETEVYVQKVKWEHLGKIGRCTYIYNEENARFVGPGIDGTNNWLLEKGERSENEHPVLIPSVNFNEPINSAVDNEDYF